MDGFGMMLNRASYKEQNPEKIESSRCQTRSSATELTADTTCGGVEVRRWAATNLSQSKTNDYDREAHSLKSQWWLAHHWCDEW